MMLTCFAKARRKEGVTLLELTLAMAVFAIALGATAQTLISYYVAMDVQQKRAVAAQNCRSVIGAMREIRDTNGDFIQGITDFIAEHEAAGDQTNYAGIITAMPGEVVSATCSSLLNGGAPADPMLVEVTSQFHDIMGRQVEVVISGVFTRSL